MQFDFLRMRKTAFFCAALFCLFSSGAVVAAEWSIEPSISLREEYNDNIRFTASPHPGVWQSRLTPSVKLSSKTEVSEVSGSAQMSINQYAGDPLVENRNDQFFTLLTRLQSERNTWAMNASYKQDSTAESERIATGVVQVRTQRSALSLSPSWTRTLTERSSFKLDYNYQEVKYDAHINLNDYTNQQVGGTLQYRLSELDTVSLSANYSILDYASALSSYPSLVPGYLYIGGDPAQPVFSGYGIGGTDTIIRKNNTSGIQASATHMFSETLRGDLSVGYRTTVTDTNHSCNGFLGFVSPYTGTFCTGIVNHGGIIAFSDKSRGNGSSFNASLEKSFESSKVSGFASRDTNPSGSGLVETDKFGVSLNRKLTEKLTGSFDAITYHTKYIGLTYPGSRYYTVEPKLNWRFTEWWTLDAGYRYARYEPESAVNSTAVANAITSNAVYLNLTYNWPKMAVSR